MGSSYLRQVIFCLVMVVYSFTIFSWGVSVGSTKRINIHYTPSVIDGIILQPPTRDKSWIKPFPVPKQPKEQKDEFRLKPDQVMQQVMQVIWNPTSFAKEQECLAKNIYFEARNQSLRGMIAVALVTANRVQLPNYPNTICEVVWQQGRDYRSGKLVAQFSWTLDGLPDYPHEKEIWEVSQQIASAFIDGGSLTNIDDFTNGATHYHTKDITPDWSHELKQVLIEGRHKFYRQASLRKG